MEEIRLLCDKTLPYGGFAEINADFCVLHTPMGVFNIKFRNSELRNSIIPSSLIYIDSEDGALYSGEVSPEYEAADIIEWIDAYYKRLFWDSVSFYAEMRKMN